MIKVLNRFILVLILIIIISPAIINAADQFGYVEGFVYDSSSSQPLPRVTIQIANKNFATLTNDEGFFRMRLPNGVAVVKLSHVGFHSEIIEVDVADTIKLAAVYLKPALIDIGVLKVYDKKYDPAQRIIASAIARKQDILSKVSDYSYDAYSRVVLSNPEKTDSTAILMILESQTTSYWAYPDQYREVIHARKQTSNIEADENMLGVGNILNFNQNRLELGNYSLVSPTAEDALEHYNYYLMDTVIIDDVPVYVLEIEPKDEMDYLFEGTIHIADSTYDVIRVEVTPTKGIDLFLLKDLKYFQQLAQFDNQYWLPVEIGVSGQFEFGLPIPGVPSKIEFSYISSVYNYNIEDEVSKTEFDDIALEVDEQADDIDSVSWFEAQMTPLTKVEEYAYQRIDSIKNSPKPVGKKILQTSFLVAMFMAYGINFIPDDFIRYNRTEGLYLGLPPKFDFFNKKLVVNPKVGYSFKQKEWQYGISGKYRLNDKRRLWVGGAYEDNIVQQQVVSPSGLYNPIVLALSVGEDPFDYYQRSGYRFWVESKLINYVDLNLTYSNYENRSTPFLTDYTFFRDKDDSLRDNPQIREGNDHALSFELKYDSRKKIKNKGEFLLEQTSTFTKVNLGIDYSSPDWFSSDYDYKKYYLKFYSVQRLFSLGMFSVAGFVGTSTGELSRPNNYYYNYNDQSFSGYLIGFDTFDKVSFVGDRMMWVYGNHQFNKNMFHRTGIPLINKIPFSLSFHGGILLSEYANSSFDYEQQDYLTAERPYAEIGFGVGHLTPFISPFNLAVRFTWQISDYDTSNFQWNIGFSF